MSYYDGSGGNGIFGSREGGRGGGCSGDGVGGSGEGLTGCGRSGDGISGPRKGERSTGHGGDGKEMNGSSDCERSGSSTRAIDGSCECGRRGGDGIKCPRECGRGGGDRVNSSREGGRRSSYGGYGMGINSSGESEGGSGSSYCCDSAERVTTPRIRYGDTNDRQQYNDSNECNDDRSLK